MIFFHSWTNFLLQWCSSTSAYDTPEICKSGIWFLAKWSSLMGIAFYHREYLRFCEINCRFMSNSFISSILKTSVSFTRGLCFGWQSDCTIKTKEAHVRLITVTIEIGKGVCTNKRVLCWKEVLADSSIATTLQRVDFHETPKALGW